MTHPEDITSETDRLESNVNQELTEFKKSISISGLNLDDPDIPPEKIKEVQEKARAMVSCVGKIIPFITGVTITYDDTPFWFYHDKAFQKTWNFFIKIDDQYQDSPFYLNSVYRGFDDKERMQTNKNWQFQKWIALHWTIDRLIGERDPSINDPDYLMPQLKYTWTDLDIIYMNALWKQYKELWWEKFKEMLEFNGGKVSFRDQSWKIINDNYWWDISWIYYKKERLNWVDYKTFKPLNNNYARDKNNIYYESKKVSWVDYKIFKPYNNSNYAKNGNNIFYGDTKLNWVDINSFELLYGGIYAKDKTYIYYKWEKILWADVNSFQLYDKKNNIFIDKNTMVLA